MSRTHEGSTRESPPGTPRWVKVFGIIFIVLVLLIGILHLTGNSLGGRHGLTPPSSIIEYEPQHL